MYGDDRRRMRQVFFLAWRKHRSGRPLEGAEKTIVDVALLHPEYHDLLERPEDNAERDFPPQGGQTNPFLHLALHLAIEEQLATDRPPGIRDGYRRLLHQNGDRHGVIHLIMECLGESLWNAQQRGTAPDEAAYLDCVRRLSGSGPTQDS